MGRKVPKEMHTHWIRHNDKIGCMEFTFDGRKIYNFFRDYPDKLTEEEKRVFDEENPYWASLARKGND